MRTIISVSLARCGFFALIFAHSILAAAITNPVERIKFINARVQVWQEGQVFLATNEVAMPFDILIQTNGVFTVKAGKERTLQEGEILGRDGMLIRPDGSILPVMDHVSMNRGRVLFVKDGVSAPVASPIKLGDGSTVLPDGTVVLRSGTPRKLLDGELWVADGALPARDTITMQGGKVMVQKDGAMLPVNPGRSITMNDGTKVMADGTIIRFNGERTTLKDGQILIIDGVVVRGR